MPRQTKLTPAGYVSMGGGAGLVEADTLQCVHCGRHWRVESGSRKGGFCFRCNGPICGRSCLECVPIEQQLENLEAGRDAKTPRPVTTPVRGLWLPGQGPPFRAK